MDDRQLRALSKIQMLKIIRQQEDVIERLTEEKDFEIRRLTDEKEELLNKLSERQLKLDQAGSLAEASVMVSGLLQAAQEAADVYLVNIKEAEAEKAATMEKLEREAEDRALAIFKETAQKQAEVMAELQRLVNATNDIYDWHLVQLSKGRKEFHAMIERTGLVKLIKEDEPDAREE